MSKTCVFIYGRMNPVHLGHGKVFHTALDMKNRSTDVKLFLSSSFDGIKNPLPRELKQYYISEFFPEISEHIQDRDIANLFDIMESLDGEYDEVIFVGGSDRTAGFQKTLDKYNGVRYNFNSIKTVLAGEDRTGCIYSSTLMRKSVLENDFHTFKLCLPGDNEYLKYDMFCGVQNYMRK